MWSIVTAATAAQPLDLQSFPVGYESCEERSACAYFLMDFFVHPCFAIFLFLKEQFTQKGKFTKGEILFYGRMQVIQVSNDMMFSKW